MSIKTTIALINMSRDSLSWIGDEDFTMNDLKTLVARYERMETALDTILRGIDLVPGKVLDIASDALKDEESQ